MVMVGIGEHVGEGILSVIVGVGGIADVIVLVGVKVRLDIIVAVHVMV